MEELDHKKIRDEIMHIIRKNPRSLQYYANQIGLHAHSFRLFLNHNGRSGLKTLVLIQNFIDKFKEV